MRLPHRNTRSLSIRALTLFLIAVGLIIPICAQAATQQLTSSPSSLSFGQVQVGTSQTLVAVLSNSGKTSATISGIRVRNYAFKISGLSLPFVLTSGQKVGISVTFTPTTRSSTSGTVTVSSNASNSWLKIPVSGTGTSAPAPSGQLWVTPSTLNIGSVAVGSSGTASGSLNATNGSVTVTAASTNNSAFKVSGFSLPLTVAAGQTVPFTVTFRPTTAGSSAATLSFISNAQTATITESLTGTGTAPVGQLVVSPASLSLGSIVVGSSGTASGSLSASGAGVTITAASTNNSAFKVSGLSLPVTVPVGQSVPFTVTFSPTAAGSVNAALSFSSNAQTATITESLSGTGTSQAGQLAVSPGTLSFGNVTLGSNATLASTLTASGAAVTVSSAAMTNSQFALSGASFPMTLNAGQSAEIYVIFAPTASGTASGTLTLNSNASTTKSTESLTGVGVAPQYSVSLSWNASTSSVAGYNIYRGTSPGSLTKLNSTVDANTAYTDNNVTAGVTYYYAATAVTSSGQESTYSTPIQVSIP